MFVASHSSVSRDTVLCKCVIIPIVIELLVQWEGRLKKSNNDNKVGRERYEKFGDLGEVAAGGLTNGEA